MGDNQAETTYQNDGEAAVNNDRFTYVVKANNQTSSPAEVKIQIEEPRSELLRSTIAVTRFGNLRWFHPHRQTRNSQKAAVGCLFSPPSWLPSFLCVGEQGDYRLARQRTKRRATRMVARINNQPWLFDCFSFVDVGETNGDSQTV